MEEVGLDPTGMAWIGGSCLWRNCNGLEWRKTFLTLLEWTGMDEVHFDLTVIAWIAWIGVNWE
jgi:hypothetical protein